jgi:hypothetical protein
MLNLTGTRAKAEKGFKRDQVIESREVETALELPVNYPARKPVSPSNASDTEKDCRFVLDHVLGRKAAKSLTAERSQHFQIRPINSPGHLGVRSSIRNFMRLMNSDSSTTSR